MSDKLPLFYCERSEKAVLGCMIEHPAQALPIATAAEALARSDFFVPQHQELFNVISAMHRDGEAIDPMAIHQKLVEMGKADWMGSPGILSEMVSAGVLLSLQSYINKILRDALRRKAIRDAEEDIKRAYEEPDQFKPQSTRSALEVRRFDLKNPPPPARPIYTLGRWTISTPGNLCVIAAQAKAGKSALVGAFIASALAIPGDTLGITSANPDGRALIHFDTEQSPADHHNLVATALRRVNSDECPEWLRSYRVADIGTLNRFKYLDDELKQARRDHNGIHSVLLDGIADFIADPNDPAEAFEAVERIHGLAVKHDTTIIAVLHFNPGSETGKTRGHLGSQLERKAETTVALEKDGDGITTVYTKLARHAHITKDQGPRFEWCDPLGMHVSIQSARQENAKAEDFHLRAIVDEMFTNKAVFRYGELLAEIKRIKGVKETQADNILKKLVPSYVRKSKLGYEKA